MATQLRRVCALDIDSQSVKRLVLEVDSGGVAIQQVDFCEIPHTESIGGSWIQRIGPGIEALAARKSGGSDEVFTSLDLQQITTRYFVLPRTTEENVRRAVETEVEAEIPLPIDQIVWDYQVMNGRDTGSDRHDIFVAGVRKDLAETLVGELKKNGFTPRHIAVSSLAAFYGYQRSPGAKEAGTVALLDIGAARTAITIGDESTVYYTRSIAVTAPQIREGTAPPSPEEVDAFVDSLCLDIKRTLVYLRSSHRRSPEIRRILLTGGASQIPGLDQVLSDRLGIKTIPYDPFSPLTITRGRELLERDGDRLAVCVGTALAALDGAAEVIDLLPEEHAIASAAAGPARLLGKRWFSPALSGVLLVLLAFILYARPILRLHAIHSELTHEENVAEEIEYLNQRKAALEEIYKVQVQWTRVIQELANVIPRDVIFTELSLKDPKSVAVSLKLGSPSQAPEMVKKIEESPLFENARHGNINVAEQGCTVTVMMALTSYKPGEAPTPAPKKEGESRRGERPPEGPPPEPGPSGAWSTAPEPAPVLPEKSGPNAVENETPLTSESPIQPAPVSVDMNNATPGVRTLTTRDGRTITIDPNRVRRGNPPSPEEMERIRRERGERRREQ